MPFAVILMPLSAASFALPPFAAIASSMSFFAAAAAFASTGASGASTSGVEIGSVNDTFS